MHIHGCVHVACTSDGIIFTYYSGRHLSAKHNSSKELKSQKLNGQHNEELILQRQVKGQNFSSFFHQNISPNRSVNGTVSSH
ncbi:hypothetical protein GUJ93_ZPchr0014g46942 [Zizania palustris]|uniref:Uncharacterized protein n=1 Tax=Zizania palustris TaxID=103762 RepID=A0A8J5SY68_ZIZPA|nr:hypothetical protein GUJ93_ZPchr0014g46942 [Zizania palustris]